MTAFNAYFEQGVALAVDLANLVSAHHRGSRVVEEERRAPASVRVVEPQSLQHLARRIRAIVTASNPAAAAALLNELFTEHRAAPQLAPDGPHWRAAPQLAPDGPHWRLHLHPENSTDEALDAVKAASGLAVLLDQDDWAILKVCAASRCDDVFQDHSRNRTRRYCSRTCANRMNAGHARARRLS